MGYVSINLQEILAFTTQTVGVNDYTGCSPYRVSEHCAYHGMCWRIQAFCAVKLMCSGARQKGRVYLTILGGNAADGSATRAGQGPVLAGRIPYFHNVQLRLTVSQFRTYFT